MAILHLFWQDVFFYQKMSTLKWKILPQHKVVDYPAGLEKNRKNNLSTSCVFLRDMFVLWRVRLKHCKLTLKQQDQKSTKSICC